MVISEAVGAAKGAGIAQGLEWVRWRVGLVVEVGLSEMLRFGSVVSVGGKKSSGIDEMRSFEAMLALDPADIVEFELLLFFERRESGSAVERA